MKHKEEITREYVSTVKKIIKEKNDKDYDKYARGWAAALEWVLELKEDDWKDIVKKY